MSGSSNRTTTERKNNLCEFLDVCSFFSRELSYGKADIASSRTEQQHIIMKSFSDKQESEREELSSVEVGFRFQSQ